MKLSWALILTSIQAAQCNVDCLNDRRDSCNLCPRFYDLSENGEIKLDFNRCAGDCQIEGTGLSQVCVPKDEMSTTTTTTQEQDTTIGSYSNYPASIDLQTMALPSVREPNVLLTVVKMDITNIQQDTRSRWRPSNINLSNNLPEPHCPEALTPKANSCPKENVRVHERLNDERKFCYYQVCRTFTADLSTVQTEQLGSGGYCVPKIQRYPQYKYCCDLEQYFTLPDENGTPRQEINFPRCHSMNTTRNDI